MNLLKKKYSFSYEALAVKKLHGGPVFDAKVLSQVSLFFVKVVATIVGTTAIEQSATYSILTVFP